MITLFIIFWIIIPVVLIYQSYQESRPYIADDPTLAPGYSRLLLGWGLVLTLITLTAIVQLQGHLEADGSFSLPRRDIPPNPMLQGLFGVWVVLLAVGSWWVWRGSGANFMARHPGVVRLRVRAPFPVRALTARYPERVSPKEVRQAWSFLLAMTGIALMAMWIIGRVV
ncbi:MAG: hypothetical protein H7319_02185 [Spirosoma sp.]|nr:hypothetical protein [Spirosoma sp.]